MSRSKPFTTLSYRLAAVLLAAFVCLISVSAGQLPQKRVLGELPNLTINNFYQDDDEYVWISTDYGICRYNGTDYVNYFHSSSVPSSIPSNKVISSLQDDSGRLWILTAAGVCRFDKRTEQFISVLSDKSLRGMVHIGGKIICYGESGFVCINAENDSISINSPEKDGVRFLAVQDGTLIWAISESSGNISCYDQEFNRIDYITSNAIGKATCVAIDNNILWIGTEHGLRHYNTASREFITESTKFQKLDFLKSANIALIYPFDDRVCICARNQDIHIWNKKNGNVMQNLALRRFFNLSYTSDFSSALYSNDGQLWIGTADRGYSIYNPGEIEFCKGKGLKRITKGKYFNSMTTAADSIIWMASKYKGLMSVNAVNNKHVWYKFIDDPELQKLGSTGLSTVFCDSSQTLWLNMDDGLAIAPVYGLELGSLKVLDIKLYSNAMCQDREGNVWIAAEDGLYRFRNHKLEARLLYGSSISDVTCDLDGNVFCCVDGVGIRHIKSSDGHAEPVFTQHRFTTELNSLRFHTDGSIWFATRNEGLYVLRNNDITHYGINNNLRSNVIESIVFDKKGNAWLGTSYGLSLIKAGDSRIITYGMSESLQVQQFTSRCTAAIGDYISLGGVSGIALFASTKLISSISDEAVEVKISSLKSHGRVLEECLPDGTKSFNNLKTAIIPYKDRNLTIDYEAVQFFHPEAVKFAYRLKGLDNDWNYVERSRSASWSYLPSGRYTFELIAMNYDGFWNTVPKELNIIIKPSPFLSWYSIIIYIILISGSILFAMNLVIKRRVQTMKLESTMKALEQEKKMARMKVGFFTNISHELRTSLSLVYGPVSMLEKADAEKRKSMINLIRSNTSSLLVLVDQLLNISRIENDCMPLMVSDVDIVPYINRIMTSFSAMADAKMIDMRLSNDIPQGILLPIDADKIQKVMQNLLSNAIKYTDSGGHITVKALITDNKMLKVSVIDDGVGMNQEEAKVVFERYRRLKSSEVTSKGSGIGLHYAKQLILLHKGKIEALVRDCGGMEFCFEVPVSPDCYSADERQEVAADIIDGFLTVEAENEAATSVLENHDTSKPLVAVIEDNPQLCSYLKNILSEDFRVITASNATDGLDIINAEMPDIITTDVMMEGMDGYELCRKVKDSPILSHIPIVILTAKVAEEDKLSGYRNKANAYITKPFNPELLVAVMRNLIEEVEKLRKDILSPNAEKSIEGNSKMSEHDNKFINRLNTIINEHISEPLIDTSELAEMLQVSRSGLFRKMKALTGVTPNEYVIIYKLNKSIEILKNDDMNISEVAYSLGFSSPSHFSNTFKNRFGVSPKNYLQK